MNFNTVGTSLRIRAQKQTDDGQQTHFHIDDYEVKKVLGNEIVEENNYYPFGLKHKGYNNVINGTHHPYKTFQGQEISEELGYNMLEFRYRHYDPAIARFVTIDPLAEDYTYNSTYAFQENKLGMGIELEGAELLGNDIAQYLATKYVAWKSSVSGYQSDLHKAIGSRVEAHKTGQERSNATIANTNINVNQVQDTQVISESVNGIANETASATKEIVRDAADTAEVVGDGMVVAAPTTGPAAPVVAGLGTTISTVGTTTNIALDVVEGDYKSAGKRVLIETVSGGLSTLVKKSPQIDDTAEQIINAKITTYENVVIPAVENKMEEDQN